jgi:hypothetical protein
VYRITIGTTQLSTAQCTIEQPANAPAVYNICSEGRTVRLSFIN